MRDPFHKALEMSRQSKPYVEDLRRLMVFHGLSSDAPDSLSAIQAKLAESNALRADLSALARHISDLGHRSVSESEMLELIALAAGDRSAVEQRNLSPALVEVPAMGALSEENGIAAPIEPETGTAHKAATPIPAPRTPPPPPSSAERPPSTAADVSFPPAPGEADADSSQRRMELAVAELKVYLDDIDRRLGRLEPRLEDITRIIQTSTERKPLSPVDTKPPVDTEPVPEDKTRSLAPAIPAAPPIMPAATHAQVTPDPEDQASDDLPDSTNGWHANIVPYLRPAAGEDIAGHADQRTPHRSPRELAGRLLAIAAVVLAVVGCIAAIFAFRNPAPSTASAVTEPESVPQPESVQQPLTDQTLPASGNPQPTPRTPAEIVPVPLPVASPAKAPETEPQQARTVQPPALDPRAQPPSIAKTSRSDAAIARAAGDRSQPKHRDPPIGDPPTPRQTAPAAATGIGATQGQQIASRAAKGKSAPESNAPTRDLANPNTGKPQVQSHSTMEGALVASRTPVYPQDALRQHREGTVVLNAVIARDGTVRRVDVVEGSPGFTRSALDAVFWWRYKPSRSHADAAETQARITFDYRLH